VSCCKQILRQKSVTYLLFLSSELLFHFALFSLGEPPCALLHALTEFIPDAFCLDLPKVQAIVIMLPRRREQLGPQRDQCGSSTYLQLFVDFNIQSSKFIGMSCLRNETQTRHATVKHSEIIVDLGGAQLRTSTSLIRRWINCSYSSSKSCFCCLRIL